MRSVRGGWRRTWAVEAVVPWQRVRPAWCGRRPYQTAARRGASSGTAGRCRGKHRLRPARTTGQRLRVGEQGGGVRQTGKAGRDVVQQLAGDYVLYERLPFARDTLGNY